MYVGLISRHFYSPWLIRQRTPKVMLVKHFNAMFLKRNFQWETLGDSRTWGAGGGTSSPSQRYGCKARPRLQVWISSASLLTPAVTSTGTLYRSRSHPSQAPALSLLFALLSPPAHYGLPFASPALLHFCNAVTTAPLTAHPCFSPLFPTAIPPTSFRLFSAITIKQNTLPTRHRPARNSSCILDFSFLPASGSAAPRCGIASAAVSTTGLQPRWNPRLQIILKIVSPSYSSHSQPSSQGRKKSLKTTNGKFQETSLPFENHISCISELLFLK